MFETGGDGVYAAFGTASDAVAAALAGQLVLVAESRPGAFEPRVRKGLHTGRGEQGAHYFGVPLYRCAPFTVAANGGQVVLTLATVELARDAL